MKKTINVKVAAAKAFTRIKREVEMKNRGSLFYYTYLQRELEIACRNSFGLEEIVEVRREVMENFPHYSDDNGYEFTLFVIFTGYYAVFLSSHTLIDKIKSDLRLPLRV